MRVYLNTDVIILMMFHNRLSYREMARQQGMNKIHLGQVLRLGSCTYRTAVKIADALSLPAEAVILCPKEPTQKQHYQRIEWLRLDRDKVDQIVARKGLSLNALASRYGCTRQNIWYLLNAKDAKVKRRTAELLAAALGVKPEEIIKEGTE